MSKRYVYMDYAATTYTKPEVLSEMMPYFGKDFGNPSSVHEYGRVAKKAQEEARGKIAAAINAAQENEIYFTSGGTEADNMAIMGAASASKKGKHIITSSIEHHAVLHTCQRMEKMGYEVTYLPVDEYGLVRIEDLKAAIRPDTCLITIMFANNEIGTIQPVAEIGRIARENKIIFHTDAVQAAGHEPIDVQSMNIDMLSMSAHKFYGPKGVGALYVRKGVRFDNLMFGGAQERNKRPGTDNVPGIVGMAKALEMACEHMEENNLRLLEMRNRLKEGIMNTIPDVRLNGHELKRLSNNLNFSFSYIEGEALLLSLDLRGIAGSSGSACTSGSLDPSHVLLAIGLKHETAHGSLRLTIGDATTDEDIDYVLAELPPIVQRLRDMSPLYKETEEKEYV
ncbi:MAG TPA: cysteine desulfurase NifS [Firmicutes bacterium]|nr:cysteine desulfurase NifS [Bacillota bacterium]